MPSPVAHVWKPRRLAGCTSWGGGAGEQADLPCAETATETSFVQAAVPVKLPVVIQRTGLATVGVGFR